MNKICKIYMGVAMVTSILIFLFGLYFSTKGIVEVTYESWRAMGVSCLAFLLALFSMMKLPFKIKQRILGLELMFITVGVSIIHLSLSLWLTRYSVLYTAYISMFSSGIEALFVFLYSRRLFNIF